VKVLSAAKVTKLLQDFGEGIDALAVIPLFDLTGPLEQALDRLEQGLVPATYGWTEEKTRLAYAYRGNGSWARSIIVAAKYYYTDERYPDQGGLFGKIARYTWRNNYRFLNLRMRNLLQRLERALGIGIRSKVYSNYTSIPEKVLFAGSGLGALGRNSVLISRPMGSFFVVGEALTDLELDFSDTPFEENPLPSPPNFALCGSCSQCIDSCPTGALVASGVVDVARCLQYLSENLVPVSRDIREKWENRLYGCTTCMDVCPHNENLSPWAEKHDVGYVGPGEDLVSLLSYSPAEWERRFQDNQIIIRDRLAIVQNALFCLGNLPYEPAPGLLAPYLSHENWIIRAAAAWAVGRRKDGASSRILYGRLGQETHPLVREEIEHLL
jgi:epoxyqueuosine reductase